MLIRNLDELFQRLQGLLEFLGKLEVLLVLPRIAQRRKARLQRRHPVLEIDIEPLEFLGEAPHLFRIHHCLGHNLSFCLWL